MISSDLTETRTWPATIKLHKIIFEDLSDKFWKKKYRARRMDFMYAISSIPNQENFSSAQKSTFNMNRKSKHQSEDEKKEMFGYSFVFNEKSQH